MVCSGSRRERRKEETRQRIIQAALELLAEKPFDKITVEDITERADVAKGTFFHHFPSKELVLVAYVEDLMEEVHEQIQQVVFSEGISTWEKAVQIAKSVAEYDGRSRVFARTLIAACCLNEEVNRQLNAMHEEAIQGCAKLALYGQARGEFRADVPAEVLARYVIRIYMQCLFDWCMREGMPPLPELVETTLQFFRPAICVQEVKE